jgi:hypothetical protein
VPRKPRQPPPDADARCRYIAEHDLKPGARVVDTALDGSYDGRRAFAFVVRHTATSMTRIRYADPDFVEAFGKTRLCNPTRLRLALEVH